MCHEHKYVGHAKEMKWHVESVWEYLANCSENWVQLCYIFLGLIKKRNLFITGLITAAQGKRDYSSDAEYYWHGPKWHVSFMFPSVSFKAWWCDWSEWTACPSSLSVWDLCKQPFTVTDSLDWLASSKVYCCPLPHVKQTRIEEGVMPQ